jgi:hypothetical protein
MTTDTISRRLVLAWVRIYTAGLPEPVPNSRRDELTSDTWEEMRAGGEQAAASLFARCLLGVPADLAWRVEQANAISRANGALLFILQRLEAGARWVNTKGIPAVSWLLGILYAVGGLLLIAFSPLAREESPAEVAMLGGLCLLAGSLVLQGRRVLSSRPRLGMSMVALGSVPPALVLFATIIIPVATALALTDAARSAFCARRERAKVAL